LGLTEIEICIFPLKKGALAATTYQALPRCQVILDDFYLPHFESSAISFVAMEQQVQAEAEYISSRSWYLVKFSRPHEARLVKVLSGRPANPQETGIFLTATQFTSFIQLASNLA
jgi:hypothetical protein